MNLCLLDESWWHVSFHDLVLCGLYCVFSHLKTTTENLMTRQQKKTKKKTTDKLQIFLFFVEDTETCEMQLQHYHLSPDFDGAL